MGIKVIRCLPGMAPEVVTIEKGLEALQREVGGYIDVVGLESGVDAYVNDEGLLEGLPFNRALPTSYGARMVPIVGPIIVAGHDEEGDTVSLTPTQLSKWVTILSVSGFAFAES